MATAPAPVRRRPTSSATNQVKPVQRPPAHRVEQGVATSRGEMVKGKKAQGGKTLSRVLEDRIFEPGEHAAFVRVGAGMTIPTGDYASLRLDVSVTLPCLTSEIDLAYQAASDKVQEMLAEEESLWLGNQQKDR